MALKTLKETIGIAYNLLVAKHNTNEIPLSILHKQIKEEGFTITELELETFIKNNPDCLKGGK